jgi:hypothetical protein
MGRCERVPVIRTNMYDVRIISPGGSITLDEWKAAVAQTRGVRLREGDVTTTNPERQVISVPTQEGDAEIFSEDARERGLILRWRPRGHAVFGASEDFMHDESQVRLTIRALASWLNAKVVGEEDEEY